MQVLGTYEGVSDQLINKSKSYFVISPCAFRTTGNRVVKELDLLKKGSFYLFGLSHLYWKAKVDLFFRHDI